MLNKKYRLEKSALTCIMVACAAIFGMTAVTTVKANHAVSVEQRSTTIVKQMKKLGFYCWKCDVRIKRDVGKLKNVRDVYVTRDYRLVIKSFGPVDMEAVKRIIEREAYRFV